ncbi:MAG TPA: CvpA family protein [Chloroflexota bacterium]|nr:CvpA family protein [Chloroflexota bacterium]
MSPSLLVDLFIALVFVLYVLDDTRRGALFGLLDLTCFGLALLAALLLYVPAAGLIVNRTELPYGLAKPAAFVLIWLASDLILGLTLRRAAAGPGIAVAHSALGRLLGVGTGAARAALVTILTLGVVEVLPLPEPVHAAVADSRAASSLSEHGATLERAISGVLGDAVRETLGLLTVRPESDERVELPFRLEQTRIDEASESRMLDLVNAERRRGGLAPLSLDPAIRQVTRQYSAEMFRAGFFSHVDLQTQSPVDRLRRAGVRFSAAGENLALAPTVDVAHQGLMNSPGHRANILSDRFTRVGIGIADGAMHGKMFTQDFTD